MVGLNVGRRRVETQAAMTVDSERRGICSRESDRQGRGMSNKKRIVIVDDDDDMREVIALTLKLDERFDVVAGASDARSAIDAIRAFQPDLVVLDHYIGGRVMGLESAPVIKTVAPETKLVVFTAKDMGFEAYFEPEVDAYLQKDRLARLVEVARDLLGLDPS